MRVRHWFPTPLWLLVLLWLGAAASSIAAAQDAPRSAESQREYDLAIRQALAEHAAGNYAEMYAAMQRAHGLQPNARTLRGMGAAAFELKDYVAALNHLRAALTDKRKPLTKALRDETADMIKRAELYVDVVTIEARPAQAEIQVDGAPAALDGQQRMLLGLGEHVVTASLEGYETARKTVKVVGGRTVQVSLVLQPVQVEAPATGHSAIEYAPPPQETSGPRDAPGDGGATQRTLGYVALGGAGVFAIGTGIAIGLRQSAASDYNDDRCLPVRSVQCKDEADRVDTMTTLAIVGGSVAGALLVTGIVLLVTADSGGEAAAHMVCAPGLSGVACAGRF